MFSSDKGILVSQGLPSKKSKGKNMKPVYRELLDNEKNLLNFQFSDIHEHHDHFSDYRQPKSKGLSHYDKKLLKMSYLHGNFKFLVNPNYEENVTYVDPDQEIKWKTVVRVKYSTSSAVNCPICLNDVYDMMFPKITRCGHIFCFSCILKYLSYKKTKCPLCEDFLMEEDLRGVQVDTYQFSKPGETIFLKLKKRRRLENTVYNAEDLTEEEDFIRIKRLSWEEILKLNEEELRMMLEYLVNLEHEHDKDYKPYVEQGINQITNNIEKIQKATMQTRQKRGKGSDELEYSENDPTNEEDFLYFYQDISGLNLFLHPINNKYIKEQYKEAKYFPSFLEVSLIEIRGFEQTELTQKRYKFVNHLPLNSNVNFAEVELKEHLSAENLEKLKTEMEAYKGTCKMTNVHQKKKEPSPKLSVDHITQSKANTDTPTIKDKKATPESKYQVQFPPSPSTLKLDCHQDYPVLQSLSNDDKESEAKGAWNKSIPSKKKAKAAKRNMIYLAEGLVERTHNNVNEENEEKKDDDSNSWKIVQPIKNFFNSLKG